MPSNCLSLATNTRADVTTFLFKIYVQYCTAVHNTALQFIANQQSVLSRCEYACHQTTQAQSRHRWWRVMEQLRLWRLRCLRTTRVDEYLMKMSDFKTLVAIICWSLLHQRRRQQSADACHPPACPPPLEKYEINSELALRIYTTVGRNVGSATFPWTCISQCTCTLHVHVDSTCTCTAHVHTSHHATTRRRQTQNEK